MIRQIPKTDERTLNRLWWGLIPYWCKDKKGGQKPRGRTTSTGQATERMGQVKRQAWREANTERSKML